MRPSVGAVLAAGASLVVAQDLTGTWSSKANSTHTGPGFYNPTTDRLIEPSHPGISYSFTDDGHYEVAYYRAVSNPTNPECPSAIMQWQHGTYQKQSDGGLTLTPIVEDGRQLQSAPCQSKNSVYSRYNQSESFEKYAQYTDKYHGIPRLDLYEFNGAPLPPLYLAYKPPQMLPTSTLHPAGGAKATGSSKLKRSLEGLGLKMHEDIELVPLMKAHSPWLDADRWWWFGLGMTGIGSVLYYCF